MFPQPEFKMKPDTSSALTQQLSAGLAWSPDYGTGLSSHLPMAQQALHELGASPERLLAWTQRHTAPLRLRQAAAPVREMRPGDLGRPDALEAWVAHYRAALAALGRDAVLREAMARLLPGVAAIAFHGAIRTAHAVLAEHDDELALALAHWASHWHPLPVSAGGEPLALPAWLDALLALPTPAYPSGSLISGRIAAWGASPAFAVVAGRLALADDTLRQIAVLAAQIYTESRNFTVLHLFTASHAMTVLQPWWPSASLPPEFAVAAAAGLRASGASLPQQTLPEPTLSWAQLRERAIAQDDEHVVKLVHAAARLHRAWPEPAFVAAACRAVLG